MSFRKYIPNRTVRFVPAFLICAVFVSACSGSSSGLSDTNLAESQSTTDSSAEDVVFDQAENETINSAVVTVPIPATNPDQSPTESESDVAAQPVLSTTRVTFDVTVPAYTSNALQVRVLWGDTDTTAAWVVDETWTVSEVLPTDTENRLSVIFSDQNGAITLGSFEQDFKTGTAASETFQINANQFDTDQWDSDGNGVSNLSELIAGTNPNGDEAPEPAQASLEFVAVKTFRFSWESTSGAEFYRVMENQDGFSGFNQISGDLQPITLAFDHPVALYERTNARYIVQACNTSGCTDSDEITISESLDSAIGYFKSSNTGANDIFGFAISLSADGTTMAIGARDESSAAVGVNGNQDDDSAPRAGAVYVFVLENNSWRQQAYLKASNTDESDAFGGDISLSEDGNTLAIAASFEESRAQGNNGDQTDNSQVFAGAVYVFARTDDAWQQEVYLKGDATDEFDFFGSDVALDGDGDTLVVGALGAGPSTRSGEAYVFSRSSGGWQQEATFLPRRAWSTGAFKGASVVISADGTTVAVYEVGDYLGANDNDRSAGLVSVYKLTGSEWLLVSSLKARDFNNLDFFGSSLDLSEDGSVLAIGAPGESSAATGINGDELDNSVFDAGAVYIFELIDNQYLQTNYIKPDMAVEADDEFGRSVSLSADGNKLAIGASGESSSSTGFGGDVNDNGFESSGAVYLFENIDNIWQQQNYIKAPNPGAGDRFGWEISLSADGETLAVGADREDSAARGIGGSQSDDSSESAGAVYLY